MKIIGELKGDLTSFVQKKIREEKKELKEHKNLHEFRVSMLKDRAVVLQRINEIESKYQQAKKTIAEQEKVIQELIEENHSLKTKMFHVKHS